MPAPIPVADIVRFGIFELDLTAREVHKAGVKVKLQDQPFRVLALLVDRAGQVVTREELQQKIWPTDLYGTFDQGLNNAIKKVRNALGDSADNPRFVETVAGLGYRFVAPVSAVQPRSSEPPFRFDFRILRNIALISLTAAALLTTLAYWAWHRSDMRARPSSEKTVLAVLPFDNLSRDPDQEFFSDGLTEEMIAQLGKLNPERLTVIARGSVVKYKGSSLPVNQIGKELHADYLLQGSVRSASDRVRITVQLIQVQDQTDRSGANLRCPERQRADLQVVADCLRGSCRVDVVSRCRSRIRSLSLGTAFPGFVAASPPTALTGRKSSADYNLMKGSVDEGGAHHSYSFHSFSQFQIPDVTLIGNGNPS